MYVPSKKEIEQVRRAAAGHETKILREVKKLVNIDSPTGYREGLSKAAEALMTICARRGLQAELVPQTVQGDHVRARLPGGREGQILLLGHMDTVFPVGTAKARPFTLDGDLARGPGVEDMKTGLVLGLAAAEIFARLYPENERKTLVYLYNTDEEIRSPSSRATIEEEARRSQACLVLESGQAGPGSGVVLTSRKGSAKYTVEALGKPAHSGANHKDGRSAIEEIAWKVLAIQALTNYEKGTTANVGVIRGGIGFNVVPEHASIEVDFRMTTVDEQHRIVQTMERLAKETRVQGVKVMMTGGITRPPMPRTEANVALFERAKAIAAAMGGPLAETTSGGGSDGNLAAAVGCPVLDGMGVIGRHAHTPEEQMDLASVADRLTLLVLMLRTLSLA